MRTLDWLGIAAMAVAVPARASSTASMTITIAVEPCSRIEQVSAPAMPTITRANQTVIGYASFQVTTNHEVIAYLGRPGDAIGGPDGRIAYGASAAPLRWSANFPGQAVGSGLLIRAGANQLCPVEVTASTSSAWTSAQAGTYTGTLSLTLSDR